MTTAPLGSLTLRALLSRADSTSLVLVTDHASHEASAGLRKWLWGVDRITRGAALGNRFRLVLDGVAVEASRLMVQMDRRSQGVLITATVATRAHAGRLGALVFKVGREFSEASLSRVERKDPKQTTIAETRTDPARVRIEIA